MKKILFLSLMFLSMSAFAHGGYYGGYRGNWVAPVIGGAIIGYSIGAYRPPVYYAPPPVYYGYGAVPPANYYAPPCTTVPIYDQYGRFLGYRCY